MLYNVPMKGIQDTLKVFGLLYNVPWQGIQDTLKVLWTTIHCALARDSGHTEGVMDYYTLCLGKGFRTH